MNQLVLAHSLPKPLTDDAFLPVSLEAAKLGQLLFYDKILSGNKNIACATCHHPDFGSSDGLSLGIGEGGDGIGAMRSFGSGHLKAERRVPRNAPALWNIGAREFTHLFHDGRVSRDTLFASGFNSPAEEFLPIGLTDLVAVQAMFPLASDVEMAGDKNENEMPGAVRRRIDYGWQIMVQRIVSFPEYVDLFIDAFDDVEQSSDITMVHIANAISAFERFEFRADESPFDDYLRGDTAALNEEQEKGMALFYGSANCAICHAGALQTDHDFHNIALPFLGPGRTRQFDYKARDMGRINETDLAEDAYKFRTPSLRNVTETGPYGHNGAYNSLAEIVMHHTDPKTYFKNYRLDLATLPKAEHIRPDDILWHDKQEQQRLFSTVTNIPVTVNPSDMPFIMAFLEALTDKESLRGRLGVPERVPSGLKVD
ncbi:hypothetical protein KO489_11295 [Reinekea forsetii]|nr:hypothetical protein [Reinekea forsetii]